MPILALTAAVRGHMTRIFDHAYAMNHENILSLVESHPNHRFLDLGCDDGTWTKHIAQKIGTRQIEGIEIVNSRGTLAEQRGIHVHYCDLGQPWPLDDSQFDVIHANQVIEHVPSIDLFAEEIWRVLKPWGYAIISTENASSWHNIGAMALGWQMFSLTNLSSRRLGIGNPCAAHRHEVHNLSSWTHKVIFSYQGLKEFFEAYGFQVEAIKGAGYYPFPASWGQWDPRHSHFLSIKIRKPIQA